jgi:GH15 family glucan-1,4-alpha-glucosidase
MKFKHATSLLTCVTSISAFAGGGAGGCGMIPSVVENRELRCVGHVKDSYFSTVKFDKTFQYQSDIPYDQGSAEVVNYLVYYSPGSEKNLGVTFHCDSFKNGQMVAAGKQFIILGSSRVPIKLGPNRNSIKDVILKNGSYTAVVSCKLID